MPVDTFRMIAARLASNIEAAHSRALYLTRMLNVSMMRVSSESSLKIGDGPGVACQFQEEVLETTSLHLSFFPKIAERPLGHNHTLMEDGHPAAEFLHNGEIMGGHEDGRAVGVDEEEKVFHEP